MNLSKEQLNEIKTFVSKKGIKYLDVQMEILDHVASGIEERMAANVKLTFEEALKQTHASFGIFGFGGVEEAIINGVGKKYNRIFFRQFLSFFHFKYVLVVLFGGFSIYKIEVLLNDYNKIIMIFLIATFALLGLVTVIRLNLKGYKNLIVYRISASYLTHIGSFALFFNLLLSNIGEATIFGVNRNLFFASLILVLFIIYVISAVKTAIRGFNESKLLIDKYQILNK
jgi:hypothetical protein